MVQKILTVLSLDYEFKSKNNVSMVIYEMINIE